MKCFLCQTPTGDRVFTSDNHPVHIECLRISALHVDKVARKQITDWKKKAEEARKTLEFLDSI